jgi:hypothetical protein
MRLDKFNKANDSVAITRKRLSDLSSSQGDHSTESGRQAPLYLRARLTSCQISTLELNENLRF